MTSRSNRLLTLSAMAVAGVCLSGVASAGPLAATATISSAPDGANFDYTIKLTDTGTTDIGTFWFAWTPPSMPAEYGFLPSPPLSTSQPAGWVPIVLTQFPGTSIEYYKVGGSLIAPGQTGTFDFTSSDSPTQLQGLQLVAFGAFPITTSFIYSGLPEIGAPAQVNPVFVPEPSSGVLSALGLVAVATWDRRRKR